MTRQLLTRDQQFTNRIMRRVYFFWFMKRIAPTILLQLGAFTLLAVGIHEFVSIRFVSANAITALSGGVGAMISYVMSAVAKTGFIPQLLFGASVMLRILVLRDLRRAFQRLMKHELESTAALQRLSR